MMNQNQALHILKQFDERLLRKTKNCAGTAVIFKDNKWKLHIFLREQSFISEGKSIHDHLLNLRFNADGVRQIKNNNETQPEDLSPALSIGEFKAFFYSRTEKFRPAPGSVSIGHIDASTTAGTFGVIVYRSLPACDYVISGSGLNPDCSGGYAICGSFNGRPCYKHISGEWYLWFSTIFPKFLFNVSDGSPPMDPEEAKGDYETAGRLGAGPYYKHLTENWYLFNYWADNRWYISDVANDPTYHAWRAPEGFVWPYIEGNYAPFVGVSGVAVVAPIQSAQPDWNSWVISNGLGLIDEHCWKRGKDEPIIGGYQPVTGAEGVAITLEYAAGEYERFILSNNHILAQCDMGVYADPIAQPGMYDIFGHPPPYSEQEQQEAIENYKIGKLEDFVYLIPTPEEPPLTPYNHVDAAICKPIDYTMSGSVTPDCTGGYEAALGKYNGKPCYYLVEDIYVLWWHKIWKEWVITDSLGQTETVCWERKSSHILGKYVPRVGTAGEATVKIGALDGILELSGLTSKVKMPEIGEAVIKIGRTTGKLEGAIIGITGVVEIGYPPPLYYCIFDKQIVTDYIGKAGDSGSFLFSKCGKRAIGLLFAGSEQARMVLHNPAICIEKELSIRFARPRRRPIAQITRKIIGKTIEGIRKICKLCRCGLTPAALRCIPPSEIWGGPDCEWQIRTTRVQCERQWQMPCEDYYCGPNPPNENGCYLYLVDLCWFSSGICVWMWYENFETEEECMYWHESGPACWCNYMYLDDNCTTEESICSDD